MSVLAQPATPTTESTPVDPPSIPPKADNELRSYVYRNVIKALAALLVLLAVVGVAGVVYEQELLRLTLAIYAAIGFAGLAVALFLSDAVTSPIPPDAILLVVAKSPLAEHWVSVVLTLGVVSIVAGNLGYLIGLKLSHTRWPRAVFGRFRKKNRMLVQRFGPWAVALGALTPVPFSVTCWSAGLLHMRWAPFALVTLLRLPRFFGYYLAIAYADTLVRLWF